MYIRNHRVLSGFALFSISLLVAAGQKPAQAPLPDIRQLMREVQEHQKQLDQIRENYTYTSYQVVQDIDGDGQVKKTESSEYQDFFVSGHVIERKVKSNDKPLNEHDQQKETERVTKLVEKAQKTPRGQSLEGPSISISRVLEIMDVSNERRELYRNDPTIVFEAARLLADEPGIHFLLSGWGVGFERLKQLQSEARLANVTLVGRVADSDLERFLAAADAWIIPYRENVAGVSVPSRFYNLLALEDERDAESLPRADRLVVTRPGQRDGHGRV